jgi:hypothetical protein
MKRLSLLLVKAKIQLSCLSFKKQPKELWQDLKSAISFQIKKNNAWHITNVEKQLLHGLHKAQILLLKYQLLPILNQVKGTRMS